MIATLQNAQIRPIVEGAVIALKAQAKTDHRFNTASLNRNVSKLMILSINIVHQVD